MYLWGQQMKEKTKEDLMIEWIEARLDMEKQCLNSYTSGGPGEMYSSVKVLCEKFLERFKSKEPTMEEKITKAKEDLENYITMFTNSDHLGIANDLQDALDVLNELTKEEILTPEDKAARDALEGGTPSINEIKHYHYDPWKNEEELKRELGLEYPKRERGKLSAHDLSRRCYTRRKERKKILSPKDKATRDAFAGETPSIWEEGKIFIRK